MMPATAKIIIIKIMVEFWEALTNPDFPIIRYAFIAGLLASISFGIVGTFVVTRRISSIAGAIAHACLGGIGAALYLQHRFDWAWCTPMLGAMIAAVLSALIIGVVTLNGHEREDSIIGALWAVGMASGALFLYSVPSSVDPMSYIFGNILIISQADLWLILVMNFVTLALTFTFYNQFVAVCFDEEFARIRGVPVTFFYLLLLCLTAMSIVLLVSVVGIVMVIALLTIPAAIASYFAQRLWQMMVVAAFICAVMVSFGLGISYSLDKPSGPVIIILGAAVYLAVLLVSHFKKRLSKTR